MSEIDDYKSRLKVLEEEVESNGWRAQWLELQEYLMPRSGQFLLNDGAEADNDGRKIYGKVNNSTQMQALNVLVAGVHGGLTNPQTLWFDLDLDDKDLRKYYPVATWFHEVRERMLMVYQQSNLYPTLQRLYEESAVFGTSAAFFEEDDARVIRGKHLPVGSFYCEQGHDDLPSSIFRKEWRTTRQLVTHFGRENVSDNVRNAAERKQWHVKWKVIHACERRMPDTMDGDRGEFPFRSVYFEDGVKDDKFLSDSGYREQPFVVARWVTRGSDVYGHSPGMVALPDIKMLQKMEYEHMVGVAFRNRPPLAASHHMRNQVINLIPGGVTYTDFINGQPGIQPLLPMMSNPQEHLLNVERVEERIKATFYNPLFLAVLGVHKGMSATEVVERHNEKLVLMGPVMEQYQWVLSDMNARTFSIMMHKGMFPPPPPELEGQEVRIKFLGVLAQAMKLVGTTSVEKVVGFVGSLAGISQEALDKLDVDVCIEEYSDMQGAPPKILRNPKIVAEIRHGRAEAQAAAAQQEMMSAQVDTAKQMAEIQKITGAPPM